MDGGVIIIMEEIGAKVVDQEVAVEAAVAEVVVEGEVAGTVGVDGEAAGAVDRIEDGVAVEGVREYAIRYCVPGINNLKMSIK